MNVQVNSDKQIAVDKELSTLVEAQLKQALGRFETHLTRLEVHLSDLNSSSKRGLRDKRCLLEARPKGQKPVSVAFEAATVEQAVRGAAGKMKRLLETSFGRSSVQTSQRNARESKRASGSGTSLRKLRSIQDTLSEILDSSTDESPALKRSVKAASKAVEDARLLAESQEEKRNASAAKRPAALVKKTQGAPKKKGTYQARRKAWPAGGPGRK